MAKFKRLHFAFDYSVHPDEPQISFLVGAMIETVTRKACEVKGHDWVDTSYGGPEGGDMSGYCKRCGYSFHHTLY